MCVLRILVVGLLTDVPVVMENVHSKSFCCSLFVVVGNACMRVCLGVWTNACVSSSMGRSVHARV